MWCPTTRPSREPHTSRALVILETEIGEDGRVRNVRVLRGVPMLDQAAIDAVRQWQFTPTLLNGLPVPVVMTVTSDSPCAASKRRQRYTQRVHS